MFHKHPFFFYIFTNQVKGAWNGPDMTMTRSDSRAASISADPPLKARYNVIVGRGYNYFGRFDDAFPLGESLRLEIVGEEYVSTS